MAICCLNVASAGVDMGIATCASTTGQLKWTLIGRYIQGEDVQPDIIAYINGMTYDKLGRLHITWCWRDDFGGGSNRFCYLQRG